MLSEQELKELEDPDTWDDESITGHPPVKNARSIVSVAFPTDDFTRVAQHARKHGMKLSEFIRVATLDRIAAEQPHVDVTFSAPTTGLVSDDYTSAPSSIRHVEFSQRSPVTTN